MTTPTPNPTEMSTSAPKAVAAQSSCTGDTWVLVPDADDGTVAVVDRVAHRVWTLCDGGRDVDQITADLTRELGQPVTGVAEFVDQLRHHGLVTG
ncbi:PqqD family protein [Nocardia sp. IFM 10818]